MTDVSAKETVVLTADTLFDTVIVWPAMAICDAYNIDGAVSIPDDTRSVGPELYRHDDVGMDRFVARLVSTSTEQPDRFHDADDPSHAEVQQRISVGDVDLFVVGEDRDVYPYDDLRTHDIGLQLRHGFHGDRNLAQFHTLFHGLRPPMAERLIAFAGTEPPSVTFVTRFKWSTSLPPTPTPRFWGDAAVFLWQLEQAGWHDAIPFGTGILYRQEVGYGHNRLGVPVTIYDPNPTPYQNTTFGRDADRVKAVAAKFKAWEDGLDDTMTGTAYTQTKTWFKAWIGFAWEFARASTSALEIVTPAVGDATVRSTLSNRAAAFNWLMESIENWAVRGIDQFRSSHPQSVVGSLIASPRTLGQIGQDGSVGAGVYVSDGIAEADWTRYTGESYRAAAGIDGN